jgi:bifunctional non-homologous end joining protein LigD
MLATLTPSMPEPLSAWSFELKYDGFRALAGLSKGKVALWSRNRLDLAPRFPSIARALGELTVGEAVLDGEVAALDSKGVPRFGLLQEGNRPLIYFAFDLLWLAGEDLRGLPLEGRREKLKGVLEGAPPELQVSIEITSDPARWMAQAARKGFEGLLAKRRGSIYENRRSGAWLKLKARHVQELAVVGYEPSIAGPRQIGSLLLAHAEGGRLVFAGKVGTGFSLAMRGELFEKLHPAVVPSPSAEGAPRLKTALWVKPKLVVQVEFSNWTSDGRVRQASFQGVRDDKKPLDAVRE